MAEQVGRRQTLIRVSTLPIFLVGFVPPLVAAILTISTALSFHRSEVSNYNWQCGKAHLPSFSRIINLPIQRVIWQILVLIHVPVRLLEITVGNIRFDFLRNTCSSRSGLYKVARTAYAVTGVLELLFLSSLSVVGERESTTIHVVLFYLFGITGLGFFISNLYCHRHSLFFIGRYGKVSYRLKLLFAAVYVMLTPLLVGSFWVYWKLCYTWGYEVFALCEYVGVLCNIGFHGCTFLDVRDKMTLTVRLIGSPDSVHDVKNATAKALQKHSAAPS
ncbi:Protein Y11D7A.9 [Aphelenchoides avenae]|nr:Protein Y11D7A.9 [Aphelenchus avenae]